MSDYLTNLAAKSLGLAEVIQPRLASRFEPVWANGALAHRPAASAAMEEDAVTEPQVQASIPPSPPSYAELTETEVAVNNEYDIGTLRQAQPQPLPSKTRKMKAPASSEQAEWMAQPQSPTAHDANPSVSRTLIPQPEATQSLESDARTLKGADTIIGLSETRLAAPDGSGQPTAPTPQPPPEGIIQPILEKAKIEGRADQSTTFPKQLPPSRTSKGVFVQPGVTRAKRSDGEKKSGDASFRSAHVQANAPTIHVTIGRLEVRATGLTAPLRKPHRTPPAMSLDEYLKQRSNRGSR